ncbi:MAG: hypothetical protein QOK35_2389 [Pseudonocardiales bacterium]|nr:hypothetical protein [Pseudonocardiales bacterium]
MAEIDQRSGTERRDADGRSGIHAGFRLGRTALTGWALTAVLGLAGFGTALGATPVPVLTPVRVADTTPLDGIGTVARGSAAAVAPRTLLRVGQVIVPLAVAADTAPLGAALPLGTGPMGTVTAASVPTPAVAPTGTMGAPGAGVPDLALGGTTPTTAVTVPAGPAAQLRQAAFTSAAPDQRAALAIRTALAQIGLPYVWGGDGPTNGDAGFDCSGLTTFSYATAGVLLPRTAHTQYNTGPHVPDGAPLQPGDLVFYGTSARVHHVGMYVGAGRMVNAPTFGKPVQVAFYRYRGDDYLGATRPAAAGGSLTTGVLPYVDPLPAVPDVALAPVQQQQQVQDRVFQAPAASLPAVLPQPGDAALPSEQQSAAQAIAESDVVTGGRVAPRPAAAPAAVPPPAGGSPSGGSPSGNGSVPVAGATTSSSAPATTPPVTTAPITTPPVTSPAVPAPVSTTAPAGATSSASTTTAAPVTSSPAGTATSATSTTSAPAAPATESGTAPASTPASTPPSSTTTTTQPAATPAPATSSSAPVVVEKASGSTTATTTLRTTTPKATTSKVATPVAPKTTTPSKTKTVTSPTTTAKAVTTTSKPAKTEDDDPTTTKTSASKTSKTKTSEEKATEDETSEKKTAEKKTTEKKTSSEKTSEKSSSSDEDS